MKPKLMHESWYNELQDLFTNGIMDSIKRYIVQETCPKDPQNIFRIFEMPINDVKLCILGLSPYPNQNDATGIAFAVNRDDYNTWPFSLKIIADAIASDYCDITYMPKHDLSDWTNQGVFLLNSALTCNVGNPNVHIELWKPFTKRVIEILDANRIVFYLLGSEAKSYNNIIQYSTVFESKHPARCAYSKEKFDSKFKNIADYMYSVDKTIIKW